MITKILFTTVTALTCISAFCCEVHLPSHLVVLTESADVVKVGAQTGCPDATLVELNETLKSVEGKITSFQLSEILKTKNFDVHVQPHLLHVQQFKNLVREHLILPAGVRLASSKTPSSPEVLSLNYGEKMEVECESCQFAGQQKVNLNMTAMDGSKRTVVVDGNFKKMVKAFRVKSSQSAFSEISTGSISEEYVEAIPHIDLVSDADSLKFYRLNKPVKAGDLLRKSDLHGVSLVKAGLKTEVIIESAMVRLKTSAISRNSGSFGDFVEVFHPEKNKKYLGKVIDINKVLVEL